MRHNMQRRLQKLHHSKPVPTNEVHTNFNEQIVKNYGFVSVATFVSAALVLNAYKNF